MSPEDRAQLGKAGRTMEEINAAHEQKAEKALHALICNYLGQHNLPYIRARMDRRSYLPRGWPDFTILCPRGQTLLIEVKTQTGSLQKDQVQCHAQLSTAGHPVIVVRSFEEFHETLALYL